MNVYLFKTDVSKYQHLVPTNQIDGDLATIRSFVGSPIISSYDPMGVELVIYDCQQQRELLQSDFPRLSGHIPVLSKRAHQCLRPHLEDFVEFLPLNCRESIFFAANILCVKDVLDTEHSDIVYFTNSNKILDVKRHVLDKKNLPSEMMFKDPRLLLKAPFVTEEFVSLVKQYNLTGLGVKAVEVF